MERASELPSSNEEVGWLSADDQMMTLGRNDRMEWRARECSEFAMRAVGFFVFSFVASGRVGVIDVCVGWVETSGARQGVASLPTAPFGRPLEYRP